MELKALILRPDTPGKCRMIQNMFSPLELALVKGIITTKKTDALKMLKKLVD